MCIALWNSSGKGKHTSAAKPIVTIRLWVVVRQVERGAA